MKSQKDFFNTVAHKWDEMCPHDLGKIGCILDLIGIQKGACVLDVGTGTGVLIPGLLQRVSEMGSIIAVDVAEKMIEVAQQKNNDHQVTFQCRNVLESEEDQGKYDHIICYSMFPHFEDKLEAIGKLAKQLKPQGKLTIAHSQSRAAINSLHQKADERVKEDNLPTMVVLKDYFSQVGLNVVCEKDNDEMFVIIGTK